ncbi:MAG: hypothetical protein ABIZ49_11530 [Opitutaceae bacterium]
MNLRLRDLARFGELLRRGGEMKSVQVIPPAAVEDIRRGGNREAFVAGDYATLPGWIYRHFWWVSGGRPF